MSHKHPTGSPNSAASEACPPILFVGWEPESGSTIPRRTAPRLHHKKSRTGCQQCRSRKVKCNEIHPICGSCSRHEVTCIWDRTENPSKERTYEIQPIRSSEQASSIQKIGLPESKDRRLLELRLLHQYGSETGFTTNVNADGNRHIWAKAVPRLAFDHNALLYSIYTFTALHMTKLEPDNLDHVESYQRYLGLTLQEHQKDVSTLGPSNADAAALTSSFLRICNFAVLQERSLSPYTPPIEWLRMSNTTGQGLNVAAWKYIQKDESSIMLSLFKAAPGMTTNPSGHLRDDENLFQAANRRDLLHLLHRTPENIATEPWNPEIQHTYERTVNCIGAIQLAIQANDLPELVFRRIVLFPMMVEPTFITLVQQQQPRALVILAHYFSFLTDFRDIWWIGETGMREVRGIRSVLPDEWLKLMELLPLENGRGCQ